MQAPVRIGSATRERTDNTKYAIHQHPCSKKYYERRQCQAGIRERDEAKDNSTDASYNRNPPIAFQGFDHHFFFLPRRAICEKHKNQHFIVAGRASCSLAVVIQSLVKIGLKVRRDSFAEDMLDPGFTLE
jgi:hypothetical protein